MDLPRVLESQGVRVVGVEADDKLDGLFLFSEHDGAFILVNIAPAKTKERQLFTLAYEYGHVLMHRKQRYHIDQDILNSPGRVDLAEKAANAFAAAFLSAFGNSLVTLQEILDQLKPALGKWPELSAVLRAADDGAIRVVSLTQEEEAERMRLVTAHPGLGLQDCALISRCCFPEMAPAELRRNPTSSLYQLGVIRPGAHCCRCGKSNWQR